MISVRGSAYKAEHFKVIQEILTAGYLEKSSKCMASGASCQKCPAQQACMDVFCTIDYLSKKIQMENKLK